MARGAVDTGEKYDMFGRKKKKKKKVFKLRSDLTKRKGAGRKKKKNDVKRAGGRAGRQVGRQADRQADRPAEWK